MSAVIKKLNLGAHTVVHVLNAPASFDQELAQLEGVRVVRSVTGRSSVAFGIGFAITVAERDAVSAALAKAAEGDAVVWIAYPKGTSRRYRAEFNRDGAWDVMGEAGFEPVRQVAIDEDWSALRFRRVQHIKTMTRSFAITTEGKQRSGKARG
ncbi:MAG: hypothetical protein MUE41_13475, partial [Gemmatimonadaceae bacterium]|nr:hypothetical protein [Gemmatimonadaceae bacterium]